MSRDVVRHFTRADLERREADVVSALEKRFGSLERALDEERTGSSPSTTLSDSCSVGDDRGPGTIGT